MSVGQKESKGKGTGMLLGGREHRGTFILRFFKAWEFMGGLGEDLNRKFISFMLIYSLKYIVFGCGWHMALIGFLLFISLIYDLSYLSSGWVGKVKTIYS